MQCECFFLPEEAMQTIITGKLPENSKSASALAAVERIEANLEASSIVLFMKGSPDFPQCGFSARVVSALRGCRAAFTHVDVLEDPELRQTLKAYSNWPTIPQHCGRAGGRLRHRDGPVSKRRSVTVGDAGSRSSRGIEISFSRQNHGNFDVRNCVRA